MAQNAKKKLFLIPIMLIVVVFIALGFIQILFQNNLQSTLNQSQANFDKMVQTQGIINKTLGQINVVSNETRTLTSFLANNFGSDSGYIERENFQYSQANDTHKILTGIKEILREMNDTLSTP